MTITNWTKKVVAQALATLLFMPALSAEAAEPLRRLPNTGAASAEEPRAFAAEARALADANSASSSAADEASTAAPSEPGLFDAPTVKFGKLELTDRLEAARTGVRQVSGESSSQRPGLRARLASSRAHQESVSAKPVAHGYWENGEVGINEELGEFEHDTEIGEHTCPNCGGYGSIWENTQVFQYGEAFKVLGDLNFNDSFGVRAGFNSAAGIGDRAVRAQFGMSGGVYDFRGTTFQPDQETQIFMTGGVSRRANVFAGEHISWGIVYDELVASNWGIASEFFLLGQARGQIGYAIDDCDEIGAWGSFGTQKAPYFADAATVTPMDQVNLYWKRNWQTGATTTFSGGLVNHDDIGSYICGFSGSAPLNHRFALVGTVTYVGPSAAAGPAGSMEEVWNASFGLLFSPGGKAISSMVTGPLGLPLMPVADNGTFLVNVR